MIFIHVSYIDINSVGYEAELFTANQPTYLHTGGKIWQCFICFVFVQEAGVKIHFYVHIGGYVSQVVKSKEKISKSILLMEGFARSEADFFPKVRLHRLCTL
jgi:hypothetical protein